ncbi:C39 family peptidase [Deinococcus cellulosilyticus]|uniref:Peptidase C39 domain-containing protein n=1 Tax=Deinococcus cellulosilyticus (strain DSM 18568 / NBRC 106333 / KACC 11606 / 5516J-15) TaxID=1223518 RepID=A0A511N7S7_DEIC1|nr:C39 family peptidase [Deinococcus cellulosilyticus]GEM48893.1 hypothetical protein DC3_45280 [Deinococcus cellulosilyticus NBRC 106333 = KACC 11606]
MQRFLLLLLLFLLPVASAKSAATQPSTKAVHLARGLTWSKQTYNNCGPQALSSLLSYYGVYINQTKISQTLKACPRCYMRADVIDPYVKPFGLRAQRFQNGAAGHIKVLVKAGYPVLVLQYLNKPGEVPHFRIVTGFDDGQKVFYINDPYYAPNATISYKTFETLWGDLYSREFIVVYPEPHRSKLGKLLGVKL